VRAARDEDAVIVGAGCVSALGYGLPTVFAALDAGQTAVQPSAEAAKDPRWGSVARMEAPYLRREVPREMEPQIKFLNGSGELAVEATAEAIDGAGLLTSDVAPPRRGLYLAQMDSDDWLCGDFAPGIRAATDDLSQPVEAEALNRASARRVKPFFLLSSLKNNAFSFLATMFELRGANTSIAGFAGPTYLTLDMAVRSLKRRSLDAAVVVATARPTSSVALAEMAQFGVSDPAGDGAAALVLRRRGDVDAQSVRAVVLGFGDATYAVNAEGAAPSTEALAQAARTALAQADVQPTELRAIVAPGLGEALPILSEGAEVPTVTWTHALGHCALAWETMQAALAVESLGVGRMPGGEPWDAPGPLLVLGAGRLGQASALVLARA
jgi:3-oxoacyl-(acyl-carrier-protein) synthase